MVTTKNKPTGIIPATLSKDMLMKAKKLLDWLATLYPDLIINCKSSEAWDKTLALWASGIKDLSNEEIRRACIWCKDANEQFMPSVGRFRHKAKGLLDTEHAFIVALQNGKDFAAQEARKKLGGSWRRKTEQQLKKEFIAVYGFICNKIVNNTYGTYKAEQEKERQKQEKPREKLVVKKVDLSVAENHISHMREILRKNS